MEGGCGRWKGDVKRSEGGCEAKSAYLVYVYARRMSYVDMAGHALQAVRGLLFRIRDGMKPTTLMGIHPEYDLTDVIGGMDFRELFRPLSCYQHQLMWSYQTHDHFRRPCRIQLDSSKFDAPCDMPSSPAVL